MGFWFVFLCFGVLSCVVVLVCWLYVGYSGFVVMVFGVSLYFFWFFCGLELFCAFRCGCAEWVLVLWLFCVMCVWCCCLDSGLACIFFKDLLWFYVLGM